MPARSGPIAVIGIGCRLSGGVVDTESLWSLLADGRNTWTDVPKSRFEWKSFDHPSREAHSAFRHRGSHFLKQDVASFDANFFGISRLESEAIDPQQRHALEVAYEAFENAGIPLDNVRESNTGVYIATFTHDYENMMYKDSISLPKYGMTGVGQAIVSNRISYLFDLRGPSVTIDTGCSGSLVALHNACQSLQLEESAMALVGGTNLILSPDTMIPMHKLHFLNSEGNCYSFDERGAGYGRGEGVVMLVLKRLEDATRAGDPIRGVIRATAVGQDGKTKGITVPSMDAQRSLIKSAYQSANLNVQDTLYIEAHGTGTVKGDLIEVEALASAFSTPRSTRLHIGSIKANIGHTESASGLAGLIKAILILERGLIPPTPSVKRLRPQLEPFMDRITISADMIPWPRDVIRRASINSFAYGGTNAHAIVDGAPSPPNGDIDAGIVGSSQTSNLKLSNGKTNRTMYTNGPNGTYVNGINGTNGINGDHMIQSTSQKKPCEKLHIVSARTEGSLKASIGRLQQWIERQGSSDLSVSDLAYTLTHRRSLMPWRYTFIGSTKQDILAALQSASSNAFSRTMDNHNAIFVFTGQGAQWHAMGRELLSTWCFRNSLEASEAMLRDLGTDWNLIDELSLDKAESRILESEVGQPASTAVQIALVDTLRWLGVRPVAVMGHSSGEIAAAYTAGALSHDTAIRVAYHRGFLARKSKNASNKIGAMMAVGLGEDAVKPYLSQVTDGKIVIACSNSPSSVTISGDEVGVVQLGEILRKASESIQFTRLKVDTAYHSHHMQIVADDYLQVLGKLPSASVDPYIRFFSSVTAYEKLDNFGASYWVSNLVSKVDFYGTLACLCRQMRLTPDGRPSSSLNNFLEIGPHSALSSYVKETITELSLDGFNFVYNSALVRNRDAYNTFLKFVGGLLGRGYHVDTSRLNDLDGSYQHKVITNLPSYPWDHSVSYWHESRVNRRHRLRPDPYHDLCGLRSLDDTLLEPRWRHILDVESLPWLRDHVVDGVIVFPGAGFIAMAMEAKTQITRARNVSLRIIKYVLKDVEFKKVLDIPSSGDEIELQMSLRGSVESHSDNACTAWEEFRFSSVSHDGVVTHHCSGCIRVEVVPELHDQRVDSIFDTYEASRAQEQYAHLLRNKSHHSWDPKIIYEGLRRYGHYWGPTFAMIKDFSIGEEAGIGTVIIPNIADSMPGRFMQPHTIHPATLDALIHSTLVLFTRACTRSVMFPVKIGELTISADISRLPGEELSFMACINPRGRMDQTGMEVTAWQTSVEGQRELCLLLKDGQLRGTDNVHISRVGPYSNRDLSYEIQWMPDIDLCKLEAPVQSHSKQETCISTYQERTELLNDFTAQVLLSGLSQVAEVDVAPQHAKYYAWMKKFTDQYHEHQKNETYNIGSLCAEMEALTVIKSHLKSILLGKSHVVSLFLENDLLRRLYAEDWSASQCYPHLIVYLRHMIFKTPGLKVLEVGAGTGGATLPLLQALCSEDHSAISQYHFTDVTAGFFDRARLSLQQWESILAFKTLDISRDPVSQGFQEDAYDVIFAYNALHVTESIEDAISNSRKLLKPNGRLILLEMTKLHTFVNAIYGLFPGWYLNRVDGRNEVPLLSVSDWNTRLQRNSFSPLEFVAHDFDGSAQRTSVLVARLLPNTSSFGNLNVPCSVVVAGDKRIPLYSALKQALIRHSVDSPVKTIDTEDSSFQILSDQSMTLVVSKDRVGSHVNGQNSDTSQEGTTQVKSVLLIHQATDATDAITTPESLAQFNRVVTLQLIGDMSNRWDDVTQQLVKIIQSLSVDHLFNSPKESSYVYNEGQILIPRLVPRNSMNVSIQQLCNKQPRLESFLHNQGVVVADIETTDSINNIKFASIENYGGPIDPNDVEIEVLACGVNTLDDNLDNTSNGSTKVFGECAGRVIAVGSTLSGRFLIGDSVCSWGGPAYTNRIRVNGMNVVHLPPSISMAVGASIPVAFLSAYHSITHVANLGEGQKLLVLAAAVDPIGQAAVQIAQHIGAEVIVVATSSEHCQSFVDMYGLPGDHVILENSGRIGRAVEDLTKGTGVDLILSTSFNISLESILTCLAPFGHFVGLSRNGNSTGIQTPEMLVRQSLGKSLTFTNIDLTSLSMYRPTILFKTMEKIMQLIHDKALKPVHPVVSINMADIGSAIQATNQGKPGKLVLEADAETQVSCLPHKYVSAHLTGSATYLIVGDLEEMTLCICHYLSTRGVSNIAILPRGPVSVQQKESFDSELFVRSITGNFKVLQNYTPASIRQILMDTVPSWPPLKGCFAIGGIDNWAASSIIQDSAVQFAVSLKDTAEYLTRKGESTPYLEKKSVTGSRLLSIHVPFTRSDSQASGCFLPISYREFEAILDYAFTVETLRECHPVQMVAGFDGQSLAEEYGNLLSDVALLSHLSKPVIKKNLDNQPAAATSQSSAQPIEEDIRDAKTADAAYRIVTNLVKEIISTFVSIAREDLDTGKSIEEMGLDSFIVFRLRNWIFGTFKAKITTNEISDSASINDLVLTILERTRFRAWESKKGKDIVQEPKDSDVDNALATKTLPRQPLPLLLETMARYLEAVEPFCTAVELERTRREVVKFQVPNSLGFKLQKRLVALAAKPQIENWLADLYMKRRFLASRSSLVGCQTYFGTHPHGPMPLLSQSERATLLTLAAMRFKQNIETGGLETQYLAGQALDSDGYRWQFNTCREPHVGIDSIRTYTGSENNYIVVFRMGHAFKVSVLSDNRLISSTALQSVFQSILEFPLSKSWLSILTADERDKWAKNRQDLLILDDQNKVSIQTIEAAAFVVCLDDTSPETPHERFRQFLFADSANRWFDKTLQFVICPNGTSASIMEHATLDGITIEPLHVALNHAIWNPETVIGDMNTAQETVEKFSINHLPLNPTPSISAILPALDQGLHKATDTFTFSALNLTALLPSYCAEHKWPMQGSIQLAFQLASRRFFGYTPPASETVSMAHFRLGRVEVNAVISSKMKGFLDAASADARPSEKLHKLAYEATREHTRTLAKVRRGYGYGRHLLALEWMVEEGEETPSFFIDPSYAKSKPGKVLTSNFTTGWLEGGFVYPPRDSVLVYFEVGEDKLSFSIFGHGVNAEIYGRELVRAAEEVRDILAYE